MMYAKLENEKLTYAPKSLIINDTKVWNASEADHIAQGWYPVIHTDAPVAEEGYYAESHYEQEDDQIVQKWEIKVAEPSAEELLAIITGESA
jgi:hypothetical protein